MASRTSESPTREGLLARRVVLMAELGMLDAEFGDRAPGHRHTESEWVCFEELEQITVLLEADTWFNRDEIDPGRPATAYRWSATA